MPPARSPRDTPSPAKKRKTESTPVKHGIDFFFKKKDQRQQQPTHSNGGEGLLFEDSDGQGEFEAQRRKQEEEDERLARELQSLEGQQQVDDEEFARRLAKDYEVADARVDGIKEESEIQDPEEDLYGDTPMKKPPPDIKTEDAPTYANSSKPIPQIKLTLNDSSSTTSLEEIYAIPLDKDPLEFNPAIDARCASTWSSQNTPYSFLTHAFIFINSTRSRLKIVDYLVNALRVVTHHDPTSLLPLVWLTTNAIAPPFEGVELNLGGSVISKALVSASGLTPGALKALYDKHGDIGDVAFEAKMAVRTLIAPAPLTVKGVYTALKNIARAKGTGSAETKRRLVERLLVSAKGEEVRYIGRTLVQHVFPI
jgi:DNA ligase 1